MAYLEELLPAFRNGAKIRKKQWTKNMYIYLNQVNQIRTRLGDEYDLGTDDLFDIWELYQEPIDWDYIIKNKCLCWFSDEDIEEPNFADRLLAIVENESGVKYMTKGKVTFVYCRPVRKDEVSFYEDKRDGNN